MIQRADRDQFVTRVAAQLLGASDDILDRRIEETLGGLARFTGVERLLLVQEQEGGRYYSLQRSAEGALALPEPQMAAEADRFPWFVESLTTRPEITIDDVDLMPPQAEADRRNLAEQGVRAVFVAPLGGPGPSPGFIGLLCLRHPRTWSEDERELTRLIGNLLGAALTRRQADDALKAAQARQRAILEGLPDLVFVLSADATVNDVHTPVDIKLPVSREQLLGVDVDRLVPTPVATSIKARIRETLASRRPQTLQYMLPFSGDRRFFEVRLVARGGQDVLALVRDITEQRQAEQQLKEQERLYEILVLSTQDAIVLSDRDGRILSWNPGAARMFGHAGDQVVGQALSALVPDFDSRSTQDVASFMASGKSGMLNRVVEMWGVRSDGRRFPVEVTLSAYSSQGETLLASVIRDITERRDAELALRRGEQRYRQLVQNSADGILLHDERGRLVDVNHRTVEMLGYRREELLHMSMQSIERDTLPEVQEQFWRSMHIDQAVTLEGTYQRKDGSQFPVEMRLAKFQGGTAAQDLILVIARDTTERKANEAVMLEHREQLRHLASQLTLTEEQQRRELAIQLHDGIGQELAMCRLRLQTYRSAPEPSRDPTHLDRALEFVEQAIGRVHSLTFDLSPPALHELGLQAALRSLGRRIEEDHGLGFEYEESGDPCDLPKELEVLLFRSVRELAINVVKHAQAQTLRVSMRTSRRQVEIAVADDGVGIDPERLQTRTATNAGGFGLFSVKERLSSVQGELVIRGTAGTIATIVVPLDEQTPYAYMLGGKT